MGLILERYLGWKTVIGGFMETLTNFPKIECPFIRHTYSVNKEQWQKIGHKLQLKAPEVYLVVDRINPGYEWVFEDEETFAVEKLNGSNIKLKTQGGELVALYNRKNPINPLQIIKGKTFLLEGVILSAAKGLVQLDGEQAGELIGPKLQGNPYKLAHHMWYPFDGAIKNLRYRSFHEHERTFDNWSLWFKDWLHSRFYTKQTAKGEEKDIVFAEGVVFYNLKRKAENKSWMAKLRRDMFDWFYGGIDIYDYDKSGANKLEENQDQFD